MEDKKLVIEIVRKIHELNGWNASDKFKQGWNAAVASCEDVITELTGISYDDWKEECRANKT